MERDVIKASTIDAGRKKRGAEAPLVLMLQFLRELELNAEGEFQVARVAASSLAGDVAFRLDVAAGVAWIDVVECVVGIHAEFGDNLPTDGERLDKPDVLVEEPGAAVGVVPDVADVVQTGVHEDPGSGCLIDRIG